MSKPTSDNISKIRQFLSELQNVSRSSDNLTLSEIPLEGELTETTLGLCRLTKDTIFRLVEDSVTTSTRFSEIFNTLNTFMQIKVRGRGMLQEVAGLRNQLFNNKISLNKRPFLWTFLFTHQYSEY